jgi:spore maturation protein CgeB
MKILAVPGVIDLQSRMGCVAQWWPLLAEMHKLGHSIVLVPYLGDSIESPWWKAYPNPCNTESKLANWFLNKTGIRGVKDSKTQFLVDHYVNPKWEKALTDIIAKEKVDAVLFMTLPVKHLQGIPNVIRNRFDIPVLFYDGDLPSSLPRYATKSFKFGTYGDNGAREYDCVISNSDGCRNDLIGLGARKVAILHYAADPSVFSPVNKTHDYADIFYYGHRVAGKENRFKYMVIDPSHRLPYQFIVGGRENGNDIGRSERMGVLSLSEWRTEACNSLINLNITKDIHARAYGTSNARIFELAMLGCCVVSDDYNGIEQWFTPQEMITVKSTEEAVEVYRMLMSFPEKRKAMGDAARKRALSCHTFEPRAKELVRIIESV